MAAQLNETLTRAIAEMRGGGGGGVGSFCGADALQRFTEAHFLHLAQVQRECWERAQAIGRRGRRLSGGRGGGGALLGTSAFPSVYGAPAGGAEACRGSSASDAREVDLVVSVDWTQVPPEELESSTSSILTCSGNMESRSVIRENIERGIKKVEQAAAEFIEIMDDQDGMFGLHAMSAGERAAISAFDGGSVFEALLASPDRRGRGSSRRR
jgi:hypothetical protein